MALQRREHPRRHRRQLHDQRRLGDRRGQLRCGDHERRRHSHQRGCRADDRRRQFHAGAAHLRTARPVEPPHRPGDFRNHVSSRAARRRKEPGVHRAVQLESVCRRPQRLPAWRRPRLHLPFEHLYWRTRLSRHRSRARGHPVHLWHRRRARRLHQQSAQRWRHRPFAQTFRRDRARSELLRPAALAGGRRRHGAFARAGPRFVRRKQSARLGRERHDRRLARRAGCGSGRAGGKCCHQRTARAQ